MEVDASSTTGSRNPSPSLPEHAKMFVDANQSQALENTKCSEIVTDRGDQLQQSNTMINGQTIVTGGSRKGSVAGDSREGSVVGGSHEGSVTGDSCEGAGDSREGSVAGGSREGSVSGNSREGSVAGNGVVTEAMLEEEQRLLEKDAQEASKEVPEEVNDLRNMVEQQRYNRLLHLLQRSTIYSKFLVKRMENQIEEDKKKQDKQTKKNKTKKQPTVSPVTPVRVTRASAAGKSPSVPQTEESGKKKRGRKRKTSPASSFKISDFMDSQGKLKKVKTDSGEGESPLATQPQAEKKATKKAPAGKQARTAQKYFEGQPIPSRQPRLLTGGIMRSYQLDGMDWIKLLYENGVNGILGDEMGLGKTIQCISVIAYMIDRGVPGPFLIAAPLSTVPNWVSEFKRFTPRIPVVLYHGTMAEREQLRRTMFLTQALIAQRQKSKKKSKRSQPSSNSHLLQNVQSVVVTSYEICMRDVKFLQYRKWRYLVVDEGHRIKNLNCKLIRMLKSYDAENRLLLTGTPLQNNLAELWSLLNFLLPDIFDDLNSFQSWFDFDNAGEDEVKEKIIAQEREQHVLRTLHQILTPFLLRRLKTDVEYSLPPKKEILVYAPLTEHQEKYYKSLLDKTILDMLEKERKEKLGEDDGAVSCEGVGSECVEVCELEGVNKRARRKKANHCNYSQLTDSQFDSIMTGDAELEDFVPTEEEAKAEKKNDKSKKMVSALNIKMTSVYMMLRLCSNHPYLLEFPLTPQGEFRVDEELVQCCGKTRMLDRLLTALIKEGHKTLVFSQFTTMLDILEDYLEMRGIGYSRLDGSMPFSDRQINITKFKSDPKCMVFLLSTRAAGLGLNLTAADTVIIYDSDWNPQSDLQAQDRCHRIGQTQPVMVYRLVTANTIDQRIVERAASKRKLEKMVIHKGKFKGAIGDDLSLDDLSELLHSVDHDKVVSSDGQVISDEALALLLERKVHTKPVGVAPDQGSECNGVAGEETSHSGVFKVLEEIGNVVCNKKENAGTKRDSKEENRSAEHDENNDETGPQDSTQTADNHQDEGIKTPTTHEHTLPSPPLDSQSPGNGVMEDERADSPQANSGGDPSSASALLTGAMEQDSQPQSNAGFKEDSSLGEKDSESKMECEVSQSNGHSDEDESTSALEPHKDNAMECETSQQNGRNEEDVSPALECCKDDEMECKGEGQTTSTDKNEAVDRLD